MWKNCSVSVDGPTRAFALERQALARIAASSCGADLRVLLRLTMAVNTIEFRGPAPANVDRHQLPSSNVVDTHRFEETINGRVYHIEVSAVQPDRWRAYIVPLAGGPTAMMPFYGSTPNEAASLLVRWLTRAHDAASKTV